MLLSFIANEAISRGSTVAVLDDPLGQIRNINPLLFVDSRGIGISVDEVRPGAICRVVSRGVVDGFTSLIPGRGYFAPLVAGEPVLYGEFVDQFNAVPASGAYLVGVGKALTNTELSVNLTAPVFVAKDSLN